MPAVGAGLVAAVQAIGVKAIFVAIARAILINVALGTMEFRDGAGERWVAVERD